MGTKDKERRVYSREFKAGAVAPVGKKEKPISRIAVDLGINENMLRRREAAEGGLPPFPGHGRLRDEDLARLRKENKSLREAV